MITAWEFVEHIRDSRLDQLIENMRRHLKGGGLVIGSASDFPSRWNGGVDHHQTKKPLWWWAELFGKHYFKRRVDLEERLTREDAWVRKVRYNFVLQVDEF